MLVQGVAFKKTFSYAGFEQQPKQFDQPKILALNIELELKAEKDNAEVRVESVEVYRTSEAALYLDRNYHASSPIRTTNPLSTRSGASFLRSWS